MNIQLNTVNTVPTELKEAMQQDSLSFEAANLAGNFFSQNPEKTVFNETIRLISPKLTAGLAENLLAKIWSACKNLFYHGVAVSSAHLLLRNLPYDALMAILQEGKLSPEVLCTVTEDLFCFLRLDDANISLSDDLVTKGFTPENRIALKKQLKISALTAGLTISLTSSCEEFQQGLNDLESKKPIENFSLKEFLKDFKSLTSLSKQGAIISGKNYTMEQLVTIFTAYRTRRDMSSLNYQSFPDGEDIEKDFCSYASKYDMLAEKLEDKMRWTDDQKHMQFVTQVMQPLYEACQKVVTTALHASKTHFEEAFGEKVSNFTGISSDISPQTFTDTIWLDLQQKLIIEKLKQITDDQIIAFTREQLPIALTEEYFSMKKEQDEEMTLPGLVRWMLKQHYLCALSDPKIEFGPAPGTITKYDLKTTKEILSPGVQKHGRIEEGSDVMILLPGLTFYYNDKNPATAVPCYIVRCKTTRVQKAS